MANNSSAGKFFRGFMIGGAIGAAAALLIAPRSGEETRTQIREKGIEFKERAEATYAEIQTKIDASVADLQARFDELSAKVDEAITQNRATLSRMAADVAQEIAPEKSR
jgi:gas vesicle protein